LKPSASSDEANGTEDTKDDDGETVDDFGYRMTAYHPIFRDMDVIRKYHIQVAKVSFSKICQAAIWLVEFADASVNKKDCLDKDTPLHILAKDPKSWELLVILAQKGGNMMAKNDPQSYAKRVVLQLKKQASSSSKTPHKAQPQQLDVSLLDEDDPFLDMEIPSVHVMDILRYFERNNGLTANQRSGGKNKITATIQSILRTQVEERLKLYDQVYHSTQLLNPYASS
jgi:hypothetical protein